MTEERKRTDAGDAFREGVRAVTGILGALRETIEQTFEDMTERAEPAQEKAKGAAKETKDAAQDTMNRAQEAMDRVRDRLDFATKRDIEELRREISDLRAELSSVRATLQRHAAGGGHAQTMTGNRPPSDDTPHGGPGDFPGEVPQL